MSSIAILVPVCSRNQNYNNFNEVPFVNFLHKSLLSTIDAQHEYTIFIGIDSTDTFYVEHLGDFLFLNAPANLVIKPIILYDCEHKPAFAWNKLFQEAYDRGHDYFFQIGDDVEISGDWTNKFIESIDSNGGVGVTGCLEKWNAACRRAKGQPLCLENAFVGRKHYEFFGSFFNSTIENWFCDEWITQVYMPNNVIVHEDLEVKNKVRYDGENSVGECKQQDNQSFRYKVKNIEPQEFQAMIRSDRKKVFGDSLEFTSTLAVALFTTKKEYDGGQVHSMMNNYIKQMPSNNFCFDWYIVFDQGDESDYKDLLNYSAHKNLQNIFIHSLEIPDKDNVYSREYKEKILIKEFKEMGMPKLGTTSGPNLLFFEGMSLLKKENIKNILLLETDTRPLQDLWYDKLLDFSQNNNFLIAGSTYKGKLKIKSNVPWKDHLNGVAIYRNCEKMHDLITLARKHIEDYIHTSSVVIKYSPETHICPGALKECGITKIMLSINYDIAINQVSKKEDYIKNNDPSLLKDTEIFTNISLPIDESTTEQEILNVHPNTVILHQKYS
jgi:hypothetical protein